MSEPFNEKDYALIQSEFESLMELAKARCRYNKEVVMVQKAFDFANSAHKNVRRRSGEPYILHPIAVAKIVVNEIGLGYKSIVAALLTTSWRTRNTPLTISRAFSMTRSPPLSKG